MLTSTDTHGQTHHGTTGLFDDQDEWEQTQARLRKAQERRLQKELKKHARRGERESRGRGSGYFGWVGRLLGVSSSKRSGVSTTKEGASEKQGEVNDRQWASPSSSGTSDVKTQGYPITGVPLNESSDSLPMYPASSIHPEPSIFLEECGMFRVRSYKRGDGGWTIVPRSAIDWDR